MNDSDDEVEEETKAANSVRKGEDNPFWMSKDGDDRSNFLRHESTDAFYCWNVLDTFHLVGLTCCSLDPVTIGDSERNRSESSQTHLIPKTKSPWFQILRAYKRR